jgi:hypothetical protein
LLAAARHNAQRSAGPRSATAKQNSKLNALKHGERASPENHYQVMLALGEDPEAFENLKQELMTSFGPGDALWEKQIDDLARLYWRRQRLERAQSGLMRRALLAVEERQHRRQQEIAGVTFAASQADILEVSMSGSADPDVRLRKLLSFLEVVREQARQRTFRARQLGVLEPLYRDRLGWRQGRLLQLLSLFNDSFGLGADQQDPELEEMERKQCGPREEAGEPQYQELLRLLDEEIASVQEEFQHAERVNQEKAAIERDACLAPVGEEWRMMLGREAALDRSIDRKIRILLSLRKEFATSDLPSTSADGDNDPNMGRIDKTLETDIPSGSLQTVGTTKDTKLNERSGNVLENKGLLWKSPGGPGNVLEKTGIYALKAGMLLKIKAANTHDKKTRTAKNDNLSSSPCALRYPSDSQRHAALYHAQAHMHLGTFHEASGQSFGASRMLEDLCDRCHSDPAVAGEEFRPGNKGLARFLALRPKAFGRRVVVRQ